MMLLPDKKDAIHKAWMYRVLEAIADNHFLASKLYFKGGTCAAMLGWLDRFSVDLDFDYAGEQADIVSTRAALEQLFAELGLEIKDQSKEGIQYFLRYKSEERNTLKLDAAFPLYRSSAYASQRFVEIDRILTCQAKETMVAHKLVALIGRFEKTGHVAGRDVYDIHHFLGKGDVYDKAVIEERRGTSLAEFFGQLLVFLEQEVNDTVITEDLSTLLPREEFLRIRKVLKRETITLVQDELKRVEV